MFGLFKKKKPEITDIIPATKAGWNSLEVVRPTANQQVEIDCNYGIRKVIYCPSGYGVIMWLATDCTHPMQNANLSAAKVYGWRPLDEHGSPTEDAQY